MKLQLKVTDNKICVVMPDVLDYKSIPLIQKEINKTLINNPDSKLVFDFSNAEYMDTSALALCILYSEKMKNNFMVCNVPKKLEYVFALDVQAEKILN